MKQLLGNRLTVRHDQGCNVTSSIIIIPEKHNEKIAGIRATVIEVGTKCKHKDELRRGDTVIVPQHFGDRNVFKDDSSLILYSGDDVLMRVET